MTSVLVVEDEALISKDLCERPAELGYAVAGTASTGEEAVCLAEELRPAIALMDIVLGGAMDGIDAARTLWALFEVPVIFLSAHSDDGTLGRAKTAGAYGYLVKPFQDRDLKLAIEMALEKSRAETNLRRSEARHRLLTAVSPAGIFFSDERGNYQQVNERWSRMSGLPPELARGDGWLRAVHPEDRGRVSAEWGRIVSAGGGWCAEYRFVTPGGKTTWVVGDVAAVRDQSGTVTGFIGSNLDVTEHRRAEEGRRSLEARKMQGELYRMMICALPAAGPTLSEEARSAVMARFGELLDWHSRAAFLSDLSACTAGDTDAVVVFQCFLSVFSAWMAALGARTTTVESAGATALVFLNCPFAGEPTKNPFFCDMCREMVSRAHGWAGLPGTVEPAPSGAGKGECCRFELRIG
jgi:PAS domain S-box-containing protein